MSTSKKSLADRGLRWSQVYEQGQDLAAEMPELRESLDELRTVAQEVTGLTAQQRHHMRCSESLMGHSWRFNGPSAVRSRRASGRFLPRLPYWFRPPG